MNDKGAIALAREALWSYQVQDDAIAKLLSGLNETKDTVDVNSRARKALAALDQLCADMPNLEYLVSLEQPNAEEWMDIIELLKAVHNAMKGYEDDTKRKD